MNYELAVLSALMMGPAHGYKITMTVNNVVGPFTKFSAGRLYPLLNKMLNDGLIEAVETDEQTTERPQRTYQLLEPGRARFRDIMLDTSSNLSDYQRIFWLKVVNFIHISLEEQLQIIDHYLEYVRTHVRSDDCIYQRKNTYLQNMADQGGKTPKKIANRIVQVVKHRMDMWEMEARWVEALKAEILSSQTNDTTTSMAEAHT